MTLSKRWRPLRREEVPNLCAAVFRYPSSIRWYHLVVTLMVNMRAALRTLIPPEPGLFTAIIVATSRLLGANTPSGWESAHGALLRCLPSRRNVRLHQPDRWRLTRSRPLSNQFDLENEKRQRRRPRGRGRHSPLARLSARPTYIPRQPGVVI
jgi:hypothetical protein